jgi:cytochrome P450
VEDAFQAFNRGMGMTAVRDPYPRFAELRRRGPIQRIDLSDWYPPLNPPGEDPGAWVVLTHALASEVLRDAETFSSSKYAITADAVMGRNLLSMDPPEHTRYRALVQKPFTARALATWESELVRPVLRDCVAAIAGRGRADLTADFTFRFPVRVIGGLFGLPDADLEDFHRWGVEIQCVIFDYERGVAASKKLTEYFRGVIQDHRRRPREDLLTGLLEAELDGRRLDEEEVLGFLRLLLPAGLETTYRGTSNLLFALLTHPDQLEAVRRDRSLVEAAVEEAMRWEPILTGGLRFATRDTTLAGVEIRAGEKVFVCFGSANRDESRYQNADAFDIFRPQKPNLAFGFGPHRCLGMGLARLEMAAALEAVLDGLPGLRLDPEAKDVHIMGEGFRAPASLPVVFES